MDKIVWNDRSIFTKTVRTKNAKRRISANDDSSFIFQTASCCLLFVFDNISMTNRYTHRYRSRQCYEGWLFEMLWTTTTRCNCKFIAYGMTSSLTSQAKCYESQVLTFPVKWEGVAFLYNTMWNLKQVFVGTVVLEFLCLWTISCGIMCEFGSEIFTFDVKVITRSVIPVFIFTRHAKT